MSRQPRAWTDVRAEAARVLEPYVTGAFKRQERAAGIADSLFWAGYLRGGRPLADARERVVADLHCRMDSPVAERAAEALEQAGLLTTNAAEVNE
jgi:hypothetical protein